MIRVKLPDGRSHLVDTDDESVAQKEAREFYKNNPEPLQRGAQFGEEDVSVLGDMARGIGAGAIGALEGLATLPAEVMDFTGATEGEAERIRKFYEKFKPTTSTTLGSAAKFITQFALPGGIASKAARVAKLGKAGQIGAFSLADVVATTPDVETLGDFFDGGPTKRISTEDLEGQEKAAAELGNRLRVASEGAAVLLGLPVILKGAGITFGKGVDALSRTESVKLAAQKIADPDSPFTSVGIKPDINDPNYLKRNFAKLQGKAKKYLTFAGEMPDGFVKQLEALKIHQLSLHNQAAKNRMEEIQGTLKVINKAGLFNDVDEKTTLNALQDFMFAQGPRKQDFQNRARNTLAEIDEKLAATKPKTLFGEKTYSLLDSATKLRKEIDDLSTAVRDDTFLDPETQKALIETIGNNRKFYGTRIYRALHDPDNYTPTVESQKRAIEELVSTNSKVDVENKLTEQDALELLSSMLNRKNFSNAKMQPNMQFEEGTLNGVAQGVLKDRKLDNLPAVREFLGEYTGSSRIIGRVKNTDGTYKIGTVGERALEDQAIGFKTKAIETVDTLAKAITKAKYIKNLDAYNAKSPNSFLHDRMPDDGARYVRLGMEDANALMPVSEGAKQRYGPLAGKWVKEEYARAFGDIPAGINLTEASKLYSTFLGLKGFSQISKTLLSPITQIRNATTAAFFALKNGNFGNGETLMDSMQTIFSHIGQRFVELPGAKRFGTMADIEKYYNERIGSGLINTNAKMGEFESLLKDSLESTTGLIPGFRAPLKMAQNLQNSFAGKVYQGSDDVWKIYSYEMELGKLTNAFEKNPNITIPVSDVENLLEFGAQVKPGQLQGPDLKRFLEREATSIVKDTVPNYARVPEAIKKLRQLPLGNFIAFPAEIIRTSSNIIGRATKELASESPEIRSIGMRRLMGVLTVDAGLYGGLMAAGTMLTGTSVDQVDAYKRSFSQDWERNAMLIPIASDKDGNITELYNFSYTNPYDYLTRPARAIYSAVENGITAEKELSEIALEASLESTREFFSPFLGESIMTEKLLDLRSNQNPYGGQIYGEADPLGLKIMKQFSHVVDGLTPGASPITLKGSISSPVYLDFQVKDFPRAIGQAFGADPITGVNRKGVRLDAAGKFIEALSGVKTIKTNVEKTLEYRGYEAADQVREASRIFNQLAKTKGNAAGLTDAYLVSNEQRFKALRDLNMAIEDAKTLGVSNSSIIRSLKAAKTPHIGVLMSGRFKPFFPSKQTIAIAMREDKNKLSNPFDFRAIGEIRQEFAGKPFRPEARAEAQAQAAPPPMAQAPAPGAVPPPSPPPQSLFKRGVQALRDVELDKLLGT